MNSSSEIPLEDLEQIPRIDLLESYMNIDSHWRE